MITRLIAVTGLLLAAAACATTSVPDPTVSPSPRVTTARPAPVRPAVSTPAHPAPRTVSAPAPRTAPAPLPRATASHVPAKAPVVPIAAPGGYVRLRGSPEIHVRTCPKVARASPGGVVPAKAGDGPPCSICRKAEALSRLR